jgi:hypothetical protein
MKSNIITCPGDCTGILQEIFPEVSSGCTRIVCNKCGEEFFIVTESEIDGG